MAEARVAFTFDVTRREAEKFAERFAAALVTPVDARTRGGAFVIGALSKETRDAIQQIVVESIRSGIPPYEAARMIKGVVGMNGPQAQAYLAHRTALIEAGHSADRVNTLLDRYETKKIRERALMIARTETMRALNVGREVAWEQAQKKGLLARDARKVWIVTHDDRLCPICEPMSDKVTLISKAFSIPGPPAHPMCLPGSALVLPCGQVTSATKRRFDGEVVVVRTARGYELTATPNHPVLTSGGWVAAGELHEGGNVISSLGGQWRSSGDLNGEQVPASIEQVAESFGRSPHVASRPVPVAAEAFHGDGLGSEVAVVWANSELRHGSDSALREHLGKLRLARGRLAAALSRAGSAAQRLVRLLTAPRCAMCGCDLALSGGGGHTAPLHGFGVALPPSDDAVLAQHTSDDVARDAELARELIGGLAGPVAADEIVLVERRDFSGHVFNLETETGAYWAQGIITHNCRCATGFTDAPVSPGEAGAGIAIVPPPKPPAPLRVPSSVLPPKPKPEPKPKPLSWKDYGVSLPRDAERRALAEAALNRMRDVMPAKVFERYSDAMRGVKKWTWKYNAQTKYAGRMHPGFDGKFVTDQIEMQFHLPQNSAAYREFNRATNDLYRELRELRNAGTIDAAEMNRRYDAFVAANRPPLAVLRTPEGFAGTLIHELTHALDWAVPQAGGQRGWGLTQKFIDDGMVSHLANAYGKSPDLFEYAISKRVEHIPDLVRYYFNGTSGKWLPNGTRAPLLTAKQWRKEFPELADWIAANFGG